MKPEVPVAKKRRPSKSKLAMQRNLKRAPQSARGSRVVQPLFKDEISPIKVVESHDAELEDLLEF